jgi:hypothetical protein
MTTCTCDTHTCSTSADALTCTNTSGSGRAIYTTSSNNAGPTLQANNSGTNWNSNGIYASTSSTSAACIWGEGGGIGVHGKCYSSSGKGVFAENGSSGYGLYASSNTGISAFIASPTNTANALEVHGDHGGSSIYAIGNGGSVVYSNSTSTGAAIRGDSDYGNGITANAWGISPLGSPGGYAVSAVANNIGIFAQTTLGNYDPNNDTNRFGYAIQAMTHCPSGKIDYGTGVYALGGTSTTGYAGYFGGRLYANYIMKGGGGFTIDHPLDPDNHFLNHGFVEAPEMSNLYKGQVELDNAGQSVVNLPDYFMVMNKDAAITLTPRTGAMPNLWADGDPCVDGKFIVKDGIPGGRVDWFVMAVRNDPYTKKYGIATKQEKRPHEKGLLINPELHGCGEEKRLNSKNMIKNMGANK